MFIRIRRPVISSFFFRLSHGFFAIFLSLFLILPTSLSWVPSAQRLFGGARPSFDRSGHGWRRLILQPPPFLPPPLLLLQVVVLLSRPSWCSFSMWMLALTLSVMSCVKWTPVSVVLYDDKLASVVSPLLPLLLRMLWQMRTAMMVLMMMMRMRMVAFPVMRKWRPLSDLPLSFMTKMGSSFGMMRVVLYLGGELA